MCFRSISSLIVTLTPVATDCSLKIYLKCSAINGPNPPLPSLRPSRVPPTRPLLPADRGTCGVAIAFAVHCTALGMHSACVPQHRCYVAICLRWLGFWELAFCWLNRITLHEGSTGQSRNIAGLFGDICLVECIGPPAQHRRPHLARKALSVVPRSPTAGGSRASTVGLHCGAAAAARFRPLTLTEQRNCFFRGALRVQRHSPKEQKTCEE
jgi:hypothetical protein